MLTTPLAPLVAFLRRHGAVEVLEGATTLQELDEAGEPIFNAVHMRHIGGNIDLWLGRATICPAALGWASKVLALAKGARPPDLVMLSTSSRFVRLERDGVLHEWRWDTEGNAARLTSMSDPAPPTPAERLKAVIEYEVGR